MAISEQTRNHDTIRKWIKDRNGQPAVVKTDGSAANRKSGLLRIKFDGDAEELEVISWDKFFDIFDKERLTFLYDTEKENRFNKFIYSDDPQQ